MCNIYRLYERGIKKARPLPPVEGNLVLFKCDDGTNRLFRIRATLRGPDGNALVPMLEFAVVERITDHAGIVIRGTELVCRGTSIKSRVEQYPQTWWCEIAEIERRRRP